MSRLAREMSDAGVATRNSGYTHAVTSYWKIVTDASVSGGCEVVSPPMRSGLDSLEEVRKVSAVLKRLGFRINRSCGFHVHHEARDLDAKAVRNLARLVNRFQPILNGLVPSSRRDGQWAMAFTDQEMERFEKARTACCGRGWGGREGGVSGCQAARFSGRRRYSRTYRSGACSACSATTRYKALNLKSLHQHGTVEFRQHSGTVEADKLVNWILLTQGLIEKAKAGGRSRRKQFEKLNGDGLKNLLRASGLQDCKPHKQVVDPRFKDLAKASCRYWRERAKHFGVLNLGDNSAARSRAATVAPRQLTPRERVAAAVAATTATADSAS